MIKVTGQMFDMNLLESNNHNLNYKSPI